MKVPGDALSGPTGLRLPSSLRDGGQHHENPPLWGIPHWASALQSLLEKRWQPQFAQSLHGLRLSMLNCAEDRSALQAQPMAAAEPCPFTAPPASGLWPVHLWNLRLG